MRKIKEFQGTARTVKVYWSSEWKEYQCKVYEGGKHVDTYHTDDKADALQTSKTLAEG